MKFNTGISDAYKPTTVDKPHLFNDGPFCSPNGFNNHCDNFPCLKVVCLETHPSPLVQNAHLKIKWSLSCLFAIT